MPSIDLKVDYDKLKDKVNSSKSYNDLKTKYDELSKKAGGTLDNLQSLYAESLSGIKEKKEAFEKKIKNQFDELLDINKITSGKGSNSAKYIKKLLIQTVKNIQPKISEILIMESINVLGCDQTQTYNPQDIYIPVQSLDFTSLLKIDPSSRVGRVFYEKDAIVVQNNPFPMNRELYQRIQSGQPYSVDNGQLYKGASGQDLFDIQYVEVGGVPYFKVTLVNRYNNINRVKEFMIDYYKTLQPIELKGVIGKVMESLCKSASLSADLGITQVEDATKFDIIVSRILGLCFDNRQEIDTSGIAKIAELGDIEKGFFEFTEMDLRQINETIANFQLGVVEYLECTTAKLPVNADDINDAIANLIYVPDEQIVDAAIAASNTLANNPAWQFGVRPNIDGAIDTSFIQQFVQGVVGAVVLPKLLLPIFIMLYSLGETFQSAVDSMYSFIKNFKEYAKNLISKIGALFVEELFELIKKDIKQLIIQIINDISKEIRIKKQVVILKLVGILLAVAQFVTDFRKCKSVVDELLNLLSLALNSANGQTQIPLPLLFASQLLDGYSETRAFINVIEELQKIGIPTGDLPDGSPNLEVLSKFATIKGMNLEETENGKVQVAVGPLTITPAGLTVPQSVFGKKL